MSVASLVLKDSLFKIIFISSSYLEDHHLKSVSMEKISLGSLVLGCCRKNMGLAKWRPFGSYFSEDLVQDFGAVTGCSHDWKKKSLPFASSPGNLRGYMRKRKGMQGKKKGPGSGFQRYGVTCPLLCNLGQIFTSFVPPFFQWKSENNN